MEESDCVSNRGTRRPVERVDLRCRSYIEQTVEIEINHVVIQCADVYAPQRLVADAEHFRPVTLRRNVFITPPTVFKPDAPSRGAATFEPDAFGLIPLSRQT